jgi:hypothetical protein
MMISNWKQELVKRAGESFAGGSTAPAAEDAQNVIDDLHRKSDEMDPENETGGKGSPAVRKRR